MQSQSVVPPERLMMRGGHDRWSGEVLEEESSMVVDDPQSVLLRPEDPVEPEIEGQSRQTKATVNRKHDREKLKARGERKRLEKNRIENRKKFTAKIKLSGRRFFCRQCLFRTVIRYRARAHALKTCGKDSKQQNRMRKKVSIACALCPETFTTRMKLTEHHTARHNKGRICSECDKKFKTDQTLVRHLQHVHKKGGKEKKHKCTDCDYKSYLKADLKKHRGRRHLSGPATKPVGVNNADCISDEENERKNIWKISDFFLLNISGQKVQQLRLQEPQKVLRKTATIFVQFEVKNILSSKHFPNTVAVCGESSVTVLLFSPDGSLARQQDIPPSLLPSSPFTVLWVPGKMQLAALAPSTVTTVDFSDLDNVRPCNIYMVAGYEYVKKLIQSFQKVDMLIVELKSDALKDRHWKTLCKQLRVSWVLAELTVGQVLDLDLQRHEGIDKDIILVALEEFLKEVKETWNTNELDLINYQSKCRIIGCWDDLFNKLKENINQVAAMKLSPYYKVWTEEGITFEDKLIGISALSDKWIDEMNVIAVEEGEDVKLARRVLTVDYSRINMWLSQMEQRMRSLATHVEADSRDQVLWSKQVEEVLDHCSEAEAEQLLFQGWEATRTNTDTDAATYSLIVRLLLLLAGVESHPGPAGDTPTPPEGWAVVVTDSGNFHYVSPLLDGCRHLMRKPWDLTKWIDRGLVSPELKDRLVFSKKKFTEQKRKAAIEEVSEDEVVAEEVRPVQEQGSQEPPRKSAKVLNQPLYECPYCFVAFKSLEQHLLDSHGEETTVLATAKLYGCIQCGVVTSNLEEHTRKHHNQVEESEEITTDENVKVRLELPNQSALVDWFPDFYSIAEVLLRWTGDIDSQIQRGDEESVAIKSGERTILEEDFGITLKTLGASTENTTYLTYQIVENEEDLGKEDMFIRECEDRLIVNIAEQEQALSLQDVVKIMNRDRPTEPQQIYEEMIIALKREDSPFHSSQFPPNVNENSYSRIVLFASIHMRQMYKLLLGLFPTIHQFSEDDIFTLAQTLSQLAVMVQRKSIAMKKLKTTIFKTNGLTNVGLGNAMKSGITVGERTWRRMREFLAALSDGLINKSARICMPMISFDNLNYVLRFMQQDFTQAVWLHKKVQTDGLLLDDHKTLDEKLQLYNSDTFLLSSQQNEEYLLQFKHVMYTVMAQLMSENIPGFKWMRKLFPKHHKHENHEASSEPTTAHMEKPLYIPESNTLDMVSILLYLQERWLEILGGVVREKERFQESLRVIRDKESTIEEREEAEQHVKTIIREHGELVIFGDQLTVEMIQSAVDAQKGSQTMLERLDVISVTSCGLFHMDMNMIIQDFVSCMPSDKTLKDELTLAWFKLKLKKPWISNMQNVIKSSGKFEEHRRFFEGVGREYFLEAIRTSITAMAERREKIVRNQNSVIKFFQTILEENKIEIFYSQDNHNDDYLTAEDDLNRYAANISSRYLLSEVHRQAEREADSKALLAIRINMVPFFFNASGNNSKYSPTLMANIVDYLGASSATKKRMDVMVCANLSGKPGCNAHQDKINEWFVRDVKQIMASLQRSFTDELLETAVTASNSIKIINQHDMVSLKLGDTGPGSHSRDTFSKEDKLKVRQLIVSKAPFKTRCDEEKKYFDQKTNNMFDADVMKKFDKFVEVKKYLYEMHKSP